MTWGNDSDSILQKIFSRFAARVAALSVAVLTVVAIGVVAFFSEQGAVKSQKLALHAYDVRQQLSRLEAAQAESRADAFRFLLLHQPNQSAALDEQLNLIDQAVGNLRSLVQDNPRRTAHVNQLELLLKQQAVQLKDCLTGTSKDCNPSRLPDFLGEVGDRKSEISTLVAAMDQEELDLFEDRLQTWHVLLRWNLVMIAAAVTIALGISFFGFRQLNANIAKRQEMERLALENAESFRALSARILEVRDVERRKLARELHDSVGQYLVGLKMNLRQLSAGNSSLLKTSEWLTETVEMTDRAIGEIRTISHLLHPPLLDELGFEASAKWYVEEFTKRSGTKVNLDIRGSADRLPNGSELALFRVLQESLTNIHRHANAQTVNVRLNCGPSEVTLEISDDGRGIPQRVLQQFKSGGAAGIGLSGMRERLIELQGTLEVESSAVGTKVRAKLPMVIPDLQNKNSTSAFTATA